MIDISTIFDKIGTTYAVNAAIELFGAVMILFAIATALSMRMDKGLLIRVLLAFAATFVSNIGDALAAIYRGVPGGAARWVVVLGNFFGVMGLILCSIFYAYVLFYTYNDFDKRTMKVFHFIVYFLGVTMLIFLIISQFTGWLYSIDADNLYKRGPLFFLSGVYILANVICALSYMIVRYKRTNSKHSLYAVIFISFPFIGMVLQMVFYGFVFLQISMLLMMVSCLFRVEKISADRMIEQKEMLANNEIELAKARDKLLLSQVRPHFIYNTLSAIRHIDGNPPETRKAITEFANYLRGNLSALSNEGAIPIEQELEHVKTYVELEKLRFGEKVSVDFDVGDVSFALPPLSVQMLVENAIKHGITSRVEGGHVYVKVWREEDIHYVEVKDDGVGFDTTAESDKEHVGLNSVKNRLETFVAGDMRISSAIGQGTTITLIIPDNKE